MATKKTLKPTAKKKTNPAQKDLKVKDVNAVKGGQKSGSIPLYG